MCQTYPKPLKTVKCQSKPRTCQIIINVAPLPDLSIKSEFNGRVCLVFRQKLDKSELLAVSHRDLDVDVNPIYKSETLITI